MMCILYKIMCISCRNSEKIDSGNVQQTQPQRRPSPISASPRLPRPGIPGRVSSPTPVHVSRPITESEISIEEQSTETYLKEFTPNSSPVPQQRLPQLEDYKSSEDLKQLPVKQLKILLSINRVDFKGCIEKNELQEKVYRLWEDNNKYKDIPENAPTDALCKLCMDAPLDCVLLECGHIASCIDCGKQLAECPICRQYVVRVVRIFKA